MERFNDLVLVIACEYKPSILIEGLNVGSEEELNIVSCIIGLVNDDDFVSITLLE